ncbi:MAG TPA: GyrI-like domain-containing protein [Candidatus Baltobacterales bacterium]|nr:GyrI-like domain-containing protein [Candidatus Baltobacterales bacterium]
MRKKPNPTLAKVELEAFQEGFCAQVMHLGPYSAEKPTIETLHAFIAAEGYRLSGKHHEIFLGDPRRAAPEKLRTIVRQPITRR